jgi:hypothetical protein
MATAQSIIDSIDARVRDLNKQIDTLTTARAALSAGDSHAVTRPRRITTSASRSTSGHKTDGAVTSQARSVSRRPSGWEVLDVCERVDVAAGRDVRAHARERRLTASGELTRCLVVVVLCEREDLADVPLGVTGAWQSTP